MNPIPSRSKTFRKKFSPYCINEWNNLKPEVRNAKQIGVFKKMIITEKNQKFPFLYSESSSCKTPYPS